VTWFRTTAVLAAALVLMGCSQAGGGNDREAAPGSASTAPTPSDGDEWEVGPSSTTSPDRAAVADVEAQLSQVVLVRGLPEAVRECVIARGAAQPSALDDVNPEDDATWDPVADLVADCQHDVVAAPQFAEEQQRARGGGLSEEQLRCLRDGYSALGRDAADDAAAEAIKPGIAGQALDEIDQVVEDCGA
jgi:hypothetical protein